MPRARPRPADTAAAGTQSQLIDDTASLAAFCDAMARESFIAIDTEFIREQSYYSRLCLIQIAAHPGDAPAAIDPLAAGMDLAPLCALLADESVTKVFHAGRQDMEIFSNLMDALPHPIYDTQIAAMVCGFGEQVGYDRLVKGMLGIDIDKASRFTDWAHRPLTPAQLRYALDDVTHLAALYPDLRKRIADAGREGWVAEEMQALAEPALYDPDPWDAWQKIKQRGSKSAALNRLRHLAAWREREARKRNLPKPRLIRDETLTALADGNPGDAKALDRIRGFPGGAGGGLAKAVLRVLAEANAAPKEEWPRAEKRGYPNPPQAVADLLRVLLKHCAADAGVASRLIAGGEELDRIALGERTGIRALTGWRGEIFGNQAVALAEGRIALSAVDNMIRIEPVAPEAD